MLRTMEERVSPNRGGGSSALRSRLAVLDRSFWPLGISIAVSVAVTFSLLFAFSAAGNRLSEAQELGLRGTISDVR